MDRRSWLWRRKSSEKSPGEIESSGSLSSLSERYSDDRDVMKASPNYMQSLEVSSNIYGGEVHQNVKTLTEKLSAALSDINAKEELVKQHAKVAEEAVSGWEKAENEVIYLKKQLESVTEKNSALQERVSHLDSALKECVRQLRQAREEHEQKIHEAINQKTHEWDSVKSEFEQKLVGLQTQLDAAKTNAATTSVEHDLKLKLEAAEREKSALKLEFVAQSEELKVKTLERDLNTQAAETASKQHLESKKIVAKLEAECRKLQAAARKVSLVNAQKSTVASNYVELLTDSQSESGERLLAVETDAHKTGSAESNDYEPSCSDSWASLLIAEFDQIKNKNVHMKKISVVSPDIGLMDDFLEMERLASIADTREEGCDSEHALYKDSIGRDHTHEKSNTDDLTQKVAELEEKLQHLEGKKAGLEQALSEMQEQLGTSQSQLMEAERKLVDLQNQLISANESKENVEVELEAANIIQKDVESKLDATNVEAQALRSRVSSLELEVNHERKLSKEIENKYSNLKDELSRKEQESQLWKAMGTKSSSEDFKIKQEKEMAVAAGKLSECQKTIASLGQQLKALATLEDFLLGSDIPELHEVLPVPKGEQENPNPTDVYLSKIVESLNTISDISSSDGKDKESLPSSSSSSSTNHDSDKSRNGFRRLFTRSKNGSNRIGNQ